MHWGRFCAAAAILALTLLSIASCGPLQFKGTDLLLNRIDSSEIADQMTGMMGELVPDAKPTKPEESKVETLFEGGDRWLHFLYIAVVALALIGLLVKPKLFAAVGILGAVALLVFLFSFDAWFKRKGEEDKKSSEPNPLGASISLDWDEGAWIGLAGFAGLAIAGLKGGSKKAAD